MSYSTHSDQAFAAAPIWQGLLVAIRNLGHRSAQRRAYHSTVRELGYLSDDALADAGIHRGDIRDIAWSLAYAN